MKAKKGQTMTDAQRALAEQYHGLIFKVLYNHGWPEDIFYDVAAIGLCTAAMLYDPELGIPFINYAANKISFEVLHERRTFVRHNVVAVSLDEITSDEDDAPFLQTMVAPIDNPEDTLVGSDILQAIDRLPRCQRTALRLRLLGYSTEEIATATRATPSTVYAHISLARSSLKKTLL